MIVKPSKFKIISFRKLSSHELENAISHRDHQGSPPKTASYSLTTHDRPLVFRKNAEGDRTFLGPNNQEFACTSLRLGVKQIGVKPIKIAHTILKTKSLPNFLPSIA